MEITQLTPVLSRLVNLQAHGNWGGTKRTQLPRGYAWQMKGVYVFEMVRGR